MKVSVNDQRHYFFWKLTEDVAVGNVASQAISLHLPFFNSKPLVYHDEKCSAQLITASYQCSHQEEKSLPYQHSTMFIGSNTKRSRCRII